MNIATEDPARLSTVDLVRLAQGGEDAAREALFARYSERVLDVVRVRLGPKLRTWLESGDILQETLAEALRSLERLEMQDPSSLIRWLSGIVEHRIQARLRHHGALKRSAEREVELEPAVAAETRRVPRPDREAARREERDTVAECLSTLAEHEREVVLLRDYAGCDWATVADQCDLPSPDAARMLHARVLTRLGRLLRERGMDS